MVYFFTNGKQFQVANIKTSRSPPSNIASKKSTPIAKGIRLIGFVGREELNNKTEYRHHLRKEIGVPVVCLCVTTKILTYTKSVLW